MWGRSPSRMWALVSQMRTWGPRGFITVDKPTCGVPARRTDRETAAEVETGVQTCALPIYVGSVALSHVGTGFPDEDLGPARVHHRRQADLRGPGSSHRSGDRRRGRDWSSDVCSSDLCGVGRPLACGHWFPR